MTFEEWWNEDGVHSIQLYGDFNANSFSENNLRIAAKLGWAAAHKSKIKPERSPFEEWWHRHSLLPAENINHEKYKKCFKLCWDAAIDAAIAETREGRGNKTASLNLPFLVDVAELERLKTS